MPVIDFSDYIAERTEQFTGREWVFRAINDWLAGCGESRFFLLTGEPGNGKTAIAARLSQFSQDGDVSPPYDLCHLTASFVSAHHFCVARAGRRIDPRAFSSSIALQLADRYQAYAQALADVGHRNVGIAVQQNVGRAEVVQGVVIENLDVSGLNVQEGFNRAVLDPLWKIYDEGLDEAITILVDALDESLTYAGRVTIAELLLQLEDLPPQVRFILTSRQHERIENGFRDANGLVLSASKYDQRNRQDVSSYVRRRLRHDGRLVPKAADLKPEQVIGLRETITNKATGNFLYAGFLLNAIAEGRRAITNLEGLPEELEGLYYDYLNRVVKSGEENWKTSYTPLLGVLSVAQAPLTLAQLEGFTDQPEGTVWQHLTDLQQFIEYVEVTEYEEDEQRGYRLYHQSVIDFLRCKFLAVRNKRSRNGFYLPEKEQHQRIIGYYQAGTDSLKKIDLSQVDHYGLRHLAYHLWAAERKEELYALLTSSSEWMKHKFSAFTGDTAYVADLDLAIGDFADPLAAAEVPTLVKLNTARQVVNARVSSYSNTDLRTLVWLGHQNEALAHARLRSETKDKFDGLLAVCRTLKEKGQPDQSLFNEARDVASSIAKDKQRWDALGSLSAAMAQAGLFDEAREVARGIANDEQRSGVLRDLAVAVARAGDGQRAGGLFGEALEAARSIADKWKGSEALRLLAAAMAQAGDGRRAREVFDEARKVVRGIANDNKRWGALRGLAVAVAQAGMFDEAREVARDIGGHKLREDALGSVAAALAQAGMFDEAREVARSITDSRKRKDALRQLELVLTRAGLFDEAQKVALDIADRNDHKWRSEALRCLSAEMAQARRYEEAQKVACSIADDGHRSEAMNALAAALAQTRCFSHALYVLGLRELDEFLQALAGWAPSFEQVEPGLSITVLREATGIAGWVRSDWREIHELLNS